jgi:hypothetical protein
MKLNFLETFSKNTQLQHLIIVKAELYHADGQADRQTRQNQRLFFVILRTQQKNHCGNNINCGGTIAFRGHICNCILSYSAVARVCNSRLTLICSALVKHAMHLCFLSEHSDFFVSYTNLLLFSVRYEQTSIQNRIILVLK